MAHRMFTRYIHLGQVLGRRVRRPVLSRSTKLVHQQYITMGQLPVVPLGHAMLGFIPIRLCMFDMTYVSIYLNLNIYLA